MRRRVTPERSHSSVASSIVPATVVTRFPTPFRKDFIVESDGAVLVHSGFTRKSAAYRKPTDALLVEVESQLRAYFARRLLRFELPLRFAGTNCAWQRGRGRIAALRRVRFVCRRGARRRPPNGTSRRGCGNVGKPIRPLRAGTSRRRCRRAGTRCFSRFDACASGCIRTLRVNGVFDGFVEKCVLVRDDIADERKLRMTTFRREHVRGTLSPKYSPLRHKR